MFNCLIMGAAGRDFHDYQTFFRSNPQFKVCAFTATQIPFIESRSFPKSLCGPKVNADIPIYTENRLPELIKRYAIDFVFLAYSDLSHEEVMHKASLVQSLGAGFVLLGPKQTQLPACKPVISVTAVRTGAGKSPLTQFLARKLAESGKIVGIIRHPMPYGDLQRQAVQRFSSFEDLDRYDCTIEEREEYEPYVEQGLAIFAGVDYARILTAVEEEADVLFWDGGNNDYSFIKPGLSIVVVDALRPGHEITYYPGETNFRAADIIVINKVSGAEKHDLHTIREHIAALNPDAEMIEADLEIEVNEPDVISGKKVLVVEDGPTLTHGGMAYGAGTLAARMYGAAELIDPHSFASGTIAETYRSYPHIRNVLPALGYSAEQCRELSETIQASGAELVVDASPANLERLLELEIPIVRVQYGFCQVSGKAIEEIVDEYIAFISESPNA